MIDAYWRSKSHQWFGHLQKQKNRPRPSKQPWQRWLIDRWRTSQSFVEIESWNTKSARKQSKESAVGGVYHRLISTENKWTHDSIHWHFRARIKPVPSWTTPMLISLKRLRWKRWRRSRLDGFSRHSLMYDRYSCTENQQGWLNILERLFAWSLMYCFGRNCEVLAERRTTFRSDTVGTRIEFVCWRYSLSRYSHLEFVVWVSRTWMI